MQHTPALELDEETFAASAARVAAMNLVTSTPYVPIMTLQECADAESPAPSPEPTPTTRKPRSDRGVQRGPKAPGEPEVAAPSETHAISITITAIQYADLEREAEKILAQVGIAHSYLLAPPAEILLHARVQKHWRTLVGK